jgi:glycosyltransferase involved in cell wall biosynthesis
MIKTPPFFSIITASYNSQKTISKTIESLLNQDYTDFEYIIIDGDSKDETLKIIKSFEVKFREKNITYKYISERDNGVYDAWNKGLKLAQGEWISFIGSDDFYEYNALNLYYNSIRKNLNINFISSKINIINNKNLIIRTVGEKFNYDNIIRNMNIAQVGAFHKKELFSKIGYFVLEYKIVGDLEFYTRTKNIIIPEYFETVTANMLNEGLSSLVFQAQNEAKKLKLKRKLLPKYLIYWNFYKSVTIGYLKKIKSELYIILNFK